MRIYQLIESTGEYEDYNENVIGTYVSLSKANRIKRECNEFLIPIKFQEAICEQCQKTDEFRNAHSELEAQRALEVVLKRCKRSELYLMDHHGFGKLLRCSAEKTSDINRYFIKAFDVDMED